MPLSFGQDQVISKNKPYNILSNEWELEVAYQQNFLAGKKLAIHFWSRCVRRFSLLMYGK